MSTQDATGTQLAIEDFIERIEESTDAAESHEQPVSEFERLTGVKTLTQRQEAQGSRLVDEDTSRDVQRATMDGHDYSDCGGDQ